MDSKREILEGISKVRPHPLKRAAGHGGGASRREVPDVQLRTGFDGEEVGAFRCGSELVAKLGSPIRGWNSPDAIKVEVQDSAVIRRLEALTRKPAAKTAGRAPTPQRTSGLREAGASRPWTGTSQSAGQNPPLVNCRSSC